MKLNGWQRIGIIASAGWILGGWLYTYETEIDRASRLIAEIHVRCDSNLPDYLKDQAAYDAAFQRCNKEDADSLAQAISNARLSAALVALAPVPLGWGFAYLVVSLVRWVRLGFA